MWFVNLIGRIAINIYDNIVDVLCFTGNFVLSIFSFPLYFSKIKKEIISIGFYSLPIVAFTSLFAGMVLALQIYSGFNGMSAETAVPAIIVVAIVRELGPVFAGLMVAGRIGASICAEIGTMKVSEQIDALKILGINPIKYLVAPKVIASMIAMPLLVIIANIVGIFGGFLVGVGKLGFNPVNHISTTFDFLEFNGIMLGLTKAFVFGIIISIIGSYQGMKTTNGAEGVGRATTNAVVLSSILILIFNYILTELFFING